jgi:hypothetical protein
LPEHAYRRIKYSTVAKSTATLREVGTNRRFTASPSQEPENKSGIICRIDRDFTLPALLQIAAAPMAERQTCAQLAHSICDLAKTVAVMDTDSRTICQERQFSTDVSIRGSCGTAYGGG